METTGTNNTATESTSTESTKMDYAIEIEVRDYELDLLGMVNNSVYQGYLEHCRHKYLTSIGLDFAQIFEKGYRMVVLRAELDYKKTLHSGDSCKVTLQMEKVSRAKFMFHQKIWLIGNAEGSLEKEQLVLDAKIIATSLGENGRPKIPPEIQAFFSQE